MNLFSKKINLFILFEKDNKLSGPLNNCYIITVTNDANTGVAELRACGVQCSAGTVLNQNSILVANKNIALYGIMSQKKHNLIGRS